MAVVRKVQCRVSRIKDHGDRVYTVELEPSMPVPRFTPGQFLHLALDPYDADGFWPESRVFSIASSPLERDRLVITYAVKRAFTSRMERELSPGRDVWVKLPYGEFTVDRDRDAVLFAGGTGITAFTAFIESLEPTQSQRVLLLYGARKPQLFVYRDLVLARERLVPTFRGCLVCEESEGRLNVDASWTEIALLRDPAFYLSGPPAMLAALTQQLQSRAVSAAAIRTDAWE